MKVTALVENTSRDENLKSEFGLSFYIEISRHRILFDTGAKGAAVVENAAALGIDLAEVDIVVLSHGHYDHGGGLGAFLEINGKAVVYVQDGAFSDYYSRKGDNPVYIGLDKSLDGHPRIVSVKGNRIIDEELFLFSGVRGRKLVSEANANLLCRRDGEYGPDDFVHEQYLTVNEDGKSVLFSGCAHCGIANIMDRYMELTGEEPDMVFGGFHLSRPGLKKPVDRGLLEGLSRRLLSGKSSYYTCHCTGMAAFRVLRSMMGDRIRYIATGDRVEI